MKEIKDDSKKWNYTPMLLVGRINIFKIALLPKEIYRFDIIPIKISMRFFKELKKKKTLSLYRTIKGQNCQRNSEEKNKAGGIMLLDFRLYYKATVIKTV